VQLRSIYFEGVRNLEAAELVPGAKFSVFAGDNGQGKTNLLECIFAVSTLRTFRSSRLKDMLCFGQNLARIEATVERDRITRRYELELTDDRRTATIDGKSARPLARYFGGFNVVLFTADDLHVARGTPAERRRFVDRVVFNRMPGYLDTVQSYEKVIRSRNRILRELARTPSRSDLDTLLEVYDEQVSSLGEEIISARVETLDRMKPLLREAFAAIARNGLQVEVHYPAPGPQATDRESLLKELRASRGRDLATATTSVGPHRHDVSFVLADHPAKDHASQGQIRALVLAWKTAEMVMVKDALGSSPILLLDDVSSELDDTRNTFLFEHLYSISGQCFITTTHHKHVQLAADRQDYVIRDGKIV
jgi:DNA replication and repair protein RecF